MASSSSNSASAVSGRQTGVPPPTQKRTMQSLTSQLAHALNAGGRKTRMKDNSSDDDDSSSDDSSSDDSSSEDSD